MLPDAFFSSKLYLKPLVPKFLLVLLVLVAFLQLQHTQGSLLKLHSEELCFFEGIA